jgi:hypothetical protein
MKYAFDDGCALYFSITLSCVEETNVLNRFARAAAAWRGLYQQSASVKVAAQAIHRRPYVEAILSL